MWRGIVKGDLEHSLAALKLEPERQVNATGRRLDWTDSKIPR